MGAGETRRGEVEGGSRADRWRLGGLTSERRQPTDKPTTNNGIHRGESEQGEITPADGAGGSAGFSGPVGWEHELGLASEQGGGCLLACLLGRTALAGNSRSPVRRAPRTRCRRDGAQSPAGRGVAFLAACSTGCQRAPPPPTGSSRRACARNDGTAAANGGRVSPRASTTAAGGAAG